MITKEKINSLPDSAGVYKYINEKGEALYIGKANSLKKRVKSYWRFTPNLHPNPNLSPRVLKMLAEAKDIEYIVVETPSDALILENSLIKQLKPKYNILLRDDKTYPYIYLDLNEKFPRFEVTRKLINKTKIKYWGPFPTGAKSLLKALYSNYPLVQKKGLKNQKKACLFYQIKRCLAPCEGRVSQEEYQKILKEATQAIKNPKILVEKLSKKMFELAEDERFEEAMELRDIIKDLEKLQLHSNIDIAKSEDFDIFAIRVDSSKGVVLRMFIREGKVISSSHTIFRDLDNFELTQAYKQAILSFYSLQIPLAKTILIADEIEDKDELEQTLCKKFDKSIKIITPKRGYKAKLIELLLKNGEEILKSSKEDDGVEVKVRELLNLKQTPYWVEVFDNSHLSGEAPVGAMVVFGEGRWQKSLFRRFQLTSRDEYSQMRELLERRVKNFDKAPPPNMWLIDGGESLRDLAKETLEKVGVNIDVVAIAKEKIDAKANRAKGGAKDKIYFEEGVLNLSKSDKRLLWLQRLRDKAHNFAITYHRKRREKVALEIELLNKKGVGNATIKRLLDYFGSFEAIKEAQKEELEEIVGVKMAKTILN